MRRIDCFSIERLYIEKAENMSIETLMEILAQHRSEQDHEIGVTVEIHTNGEPVLNLFGFKTKESIKRQIEKDKIKSGMLDFIDESNTEMSIGVLTKKRDDLLNKIIRNKELLKNLEETE